MRFYGDIALPDGIEIGIEKGIRILDDQVSVANMEGLIESSGIPGGYCLYNGLNIFEIFRQLNVKAVSLANNHVNDISENFEYTKELLKRNDIKWFGAGYTEKEAREPAVIEENNQQYIIYGFGWNVIGCRKKKSSNLYINQLTTQNVIKCVNHGKKKYGKARLILYFHWDYELEVYPQPLHRMIAHRAISEGAYAVVGCHPHCIQPVEVYDDHIIAYSLGNFIIPNGIFMKGKLSYPEICCDEMAVELNDNHIAFLHFKYDGEHTVSLLEDYGIDEIRAPFSDLDEKTYVNWFRKKRRKKKLLPIFSSDKKAEKLIKYFWIRVREAMIYVLLKLNLKSGPH